MCFCLICLGFLGCVGLNKIWGGGWFGLGFFFYIALRITRSVVNMVISIHTTGNQNVLRLHVKGRLAAVVSKIHSNSCYVY